MEDDSAPPRRQQYQNVRSTNSINWRLKDDNAGQASSPQQGRYRRDQNGQEPYSREGSGYGSGYGNRRSNYDGQPREREQREIPATPETPRLYVGNLLYTAQSADITNFFADNGFNVVNVSMNIDPATGRNPSYCFVDFESVEDATRAMESLNGAEVLGRSVRINPGVARKEGQRDGGMRRGFGGEQRGPGGGWREREAGGAQDQYQPRGSNERGWQPRERDQAPRQPQGEQSKRLYVGGLPPIEPQSSVEAEIATLFSRAEPPIEFVSVSNLIAPHPSKANEPGDHHYLFVDLKAEADAERAIELFNDVDSPWSEGGRLRVNRAREAREREGGARRGGREGGRGGFGRAPWRGEQSYE